MPNWGPAVIGVILLTGCAAAPAEEAAPANQKACPDFFVAVSHIDDRLDATDNDMDEWDAIRGDLDAIALRADGEVAARISALVAGWPSLVDVWIYQETDGLNRHIEDITRACEADGFPISLLSFG